MEKLKAYTFVFLQFLLIGIILVTGKMIAENKIYFFVELSGVLIGCWAIISLKIGNFNATPTVKKNAHLVKHGPYKFLRHPMYLAVLLVVFALISDDFTFWRLLAGILLFVVLIFKLFYEEKLLLAHFKEYSDYMKTTKRFIPFIF